MKRIVRKIQFIGLGNMGLALALNLYDQGYAISVWLRSKSPSIKKAKQSGFTIHQLDDHTSFDQTPLIMSFPDEQHLNFLKKYHQSIEPKTPIIFLHGLSLHQHRLRELFPQLNLILLAPKGIAREIRQRYLNHLSSPAFYQLSSKHRSLTIVKKLAKDMSLILGPKAVTAEMEVLSDLFSEQSLLCTLLPYSCAHSFEMLINKGVDPHLAYAECWFEIMLIAKAMIETGPEDFFKLISPTARAGAIKVMKKLSKDQLFEKMYLELINDIENQNFYQELPQYLKQNIPQLKSQKKLQQIHQAWRGALYETKT